MSQEQEQKTISPQQIAGMAALVAREMQTSYRTKKHGGYRIYEDNKIRIALDTYVPNVDILLLREEGPMTVFVAGYSSWGHPQVFHPGRWMEHLASLVPKARELKTEREAEEQEQKRRRREAPFTPIDDSAMFPGN